MKDSIPTQSSKNPNLVKITDSLHFIVAFVFGLSYVFLAILSFLWIIGLIPWNNPLIGLGRDLLMAVVLGLVGLLFLRSAYNELVADRQQAIAHLYVGLGLGFCLGILQTAVFLANTIEAVVLQSEEFIGWLPSSDLAPMILLGFISGITLLILIRYIHGGE